MSENQKTETISIDFRDAQIDFGVLGPAATLLLFNGFGFSCAPYNIV